MTAGLDIFAAGDLAALQSAQRSWAATPVVERLRLVRRLRHLIAGRSREFAAAIARDPADTLVSEILPLAEACRFLERTAENTLRPHRMDSTGRPWWLGGIELEIRRDPFGVVLIVGPSNYPLFLPAVHALQALVAGNAVVIKPGRGGLPCMQIFCNSLRQAGFDLKLFRLTGEDTVEVEAAINAGVDKVVLTGSSDTGKTVLGHLAQQGTPSVMELSGHDPVFVREGADLNLVVKALRFGLELNGGETCIAPKTVYVPHSLYAPLSSLLVQHAIPIPVIAASDEEALRKAVESGYALGASVFGKVEEATRFARLIPVGVVVVNDMIVPTADPRVPFGGRGRSGFGVTRGAEGLLELTTIKAILVRRSRWLPHLEPRRDSDASLFASFIEWSHGDSLAGRIQSLTQLIRIALRRRKSA